jgi:hypothetical protein
VSLLLRAKETRLTLTARRLQDVRGVGLAHFFEGKAGLASPFGLAHVVTRCRGMFPYQGSLSKRNSNFVRVDGAHDSPVGRN